MPAVTSHSEYAYPASPDPAELVPQHDGRRDRAVGERAELGGEQLVDLGRRQEREDRLARRAGVQREAPADLDAHLHRAQPFEEVDDDPVGAVADREDPRLARRRGGSGRATGYAASCRPCSLAAPRDTSSTRGVSTQRVHSEPSGRIQPASRSVINARCTVLFGLPSASATSATRTG